MEPPPEAGLPAEAGEATDAGRGGGGSAAPVLTPLGGPLLIGIGNRLRGDDGVGARLAERAERWMQPGSPPPLAVRRVQQLTPELAEELSRCRAVLFIDAWMAPAGALPERIRLEPAGLEQGSHRLDPAALLAISAALYGCAPEAELLRVPAHAFGHGTDLSAALRAQWPLAEALLLDWLQRQA